MSAHLYVPPHLSVDWLNAVIIPAVLTVTLGLYAGLVGTRMFAFFQVRTKAVSWVLRLKQEVFDLDHCSPRDLSNAFTGASHEIMTEIRGLGHEKLTRVLQGIFSHHFEFWARSIRIEPTPAGAIVFPEKEEMVRYFAGRGLELFGNMMPRGATPQDTAKYVWMELLGNYRDEYLNQFSSHVAQIASIGPDWSTLLNPLFFPNYLSAEGRNIGLLVRRPSLWKRFVARIRRIRSGRRKRTI